MVIFQNTLLTRTYCDEAGDFAVCNTLGPMDIHLSNVLTDHFSNSLPEKTTKGILMKFSQCPFKNIFYRLPFSNRGIYLQIIHVKQKAIFKF